MLTWLNNRRRAHCIIIIIKAPVGQQEGDLRNLVVTVLWSRSRRHTLLLSPLCFVGTLLGLDAVAIPDLLPLDGLAKLEQVGHGLEE